MVGARHQVQLDFIEDIYGRRLYRCRRGYQLAGKPHRIRGGKHIGSRIIGLDPMKTDFIWTKLYRDLNWVGPYGASMCAISGIDMALLDLKGKVLGVPCYELLGGAYRKDILLYANYWFTKGGTMKPIMQNRHVR